MNAAPLQIRMTSDRGRGLFADVPIPRGGLIVEMLGDRVASDDLPADGLAMQIDDDLWLVSPGDSLDDCANHSCEPNAGFLTGDPVLYALRDIAVGEEITWDYSTSIDCLDWSLECRCGTPGCRQVVKSWQELSTDDRDRLRPIALRYLRDR